MLDALVGKRKPDQVIPRESVRSNVTHSVSFGPAGFNMAYTGGPLKIIRQHEREFADAAYLGTSTGSVVACCTCVGMSYETLASLMEHFNQEFAALGPQAWHKLNGMLGELLERELPYDAHTRCSGRLVIGMTHIHCSIPSVCNAMCAMLIAATSAATAATTYVPSHHLHKRASWPIAFTLAFLSVFILWIGTIQKHQAFKSFFESKQELIGAILGSCSIPLLQDKFPLRRASFDKWMIDGAFTMNHAVLETHSVAQGKTITVEWDVNRVPHPDVMPSVAIAPRIVTPPSTQVMYELLDSGARDFARYLAKKASMKWRGSGQLTVRDATFCSLTM